MSVNKVILIGNAGGDPKVTVLPSGMKVATVSLATTERAYTKQDGTQVPEQTDWHTVSVFGRLAEVVESYVRKGMRLYVSGRIRYRQYEKDGQTRYYTEILADEMQMLDRKQQEQQSQPMPEPVPAYTQYQQPQYIQPPQYQQPHPVPQPQQGDLPF